MSHKPYMSSTTFCYGNVCLCIHLLDGISSVKIRASPCGCDSLPFTEEGLLVHKLAWAALFLTLVVETCSFLNRWSWILSPVLSICNLVGCCHLRLYIEPDLLLWVCYQESRSSLIEEKIPLSSKTSPEVCFSFSLFYSYDSSDRCLKNT